MLKFNLCPQRQVIKLPLNIDFLKVQYTNNLNMTLAVLRRCKITVDYSTPFVYKTERSLQKKSAPKFVDIKFFQRLEHIFAK